MTYSPGHLTTQLQKAPFTWVMPWQGIQGDQHASRAVQGFSPAHDVDSLKQCFHGAWMQVYQSAVHTVLSRLVFRDLPRLNPLQAMQTHGNMPGTWYVLKDCFGKFERK